MIEFSKAIIVNGVACWIVVLAAVLLDLWDAIYTARKIRQPVRSRKLRTTIDKFCEYWRILVIALGMDIVVAQLPFYRFPYVSMLICLCLLLVEGKSMLEHARLRKSCAVQLPEIIRAVIKSATAGDARQVIDMIAQFLETSKKK